MSDKSRELPPPREKQAQPSKEAKTTNMVESTVAAARSFSLVIRFSSGVVRNQQPAPRDVPVLDGDSFKQIQGSTHFRALTVEIFSVDRF
jgi:hypothetical protein